MAAVDTNVIVNAIFNHSRYDNLTRPFLENQVPVQVAVQVWLLTEAHVRPPTQLTWLSFG
jgi:predicted nucleic acid-binding protein